MTTVYIEFERMPIEPGNWTSPTGMKFERVGIETRLYLAGKVIGKTYYGTWERAMCGALFDAVGHTYGIHNAFKRWIYLARKHYELKRGGYIEAHYFSDDIEKEFGRVKVTIAP